MGAFDRFKKKAPCEESQEEDAAVKIALDHMEAQSFFTKEVLKERRNKLKDMLDEMTNKKEITHNG